VLTGQSRVGKAREQSAEVWWTFDSLGQLWPGVTRRRRGRPVRMRSASIPADRGGKTYHVPQTADRRRKARPTSYVAVTTKRGRAVAPHEACGNGITLDFQRFESVTLLPRTTVPRLIKGSRNAQ
jgi:hypothetical protein